MPPNIQSIPEAPEALIAADGKGGQESKVTEQKVVVVWRNVLLFIYLHTAAAYGLYLCFTAAKWQTILFAFVTYVMSGLGITAGAHRLWAHRTYKAKFPLRVLLAFFNSIAFENSIYEWARDHRVHHKYSETNADPHNATRGFFFAHIGWLLCKKHPEVREKGKTVDLSDVLADPVVQFQRRFYTSLVLTCCFLLPTLIPVFFWSETLWTSFPVCLFRYCFMLHMTWLVNSAAHMWGNRPYDVHINPSENLVVCLGALGEGYHNYHHTFPWDYSTSEYGSRVNFTTGFINFFAAVGWAYDLKKVSPEMIKARQSRTGPNAMHRD